MIETREFLRSLFDAAVGAADPKRVVPGHLPEPSSGRTLLLAAGKAAASMSAAVEASWPSELEGMAVTRYGHSVTCRNIQVIEAGHPLPDAAGRNAAEQFLKRASGLGPDDLLLFLLSGGASALLSQPRQGLSVDEKRRINQALLEAGAPIGDMNCLRKHLSAIKGGHLAAAAYPAHVVTLAISDVPGDDPAVIGSGPTAPDPTSCNDALKIARRYAIDLPQAAKLALEQGKWETIKPGDQVVSGSDYRLIARPVDALAAAAGVARGKGFEVIDLGSDLEGEARELAVQHANLARSLTGRVLLSGGEVTVTIDSPGRQGGPNCEYLLALALALDGEPGVHAIACDTDGVDGSGDAAGAVIGPDTLERARVAGIDAGSMLQNHDSYGFFERLGDLVVTGPTRTNVNDFRAILTTA